MTRGIRLSLAVTILLVTSALLYGRGDKDRQVASEPLASLPTQFDKWHGRDRSLDPRIIEVLGKGDFLSRLYTSSTPEPPIDLFIGYFPSQRSGSSIHSPKNCLPGAGWYFASSAQNHIQGDDRKSYQVGEYVISNGSARQFVIYWYEAHGRSVASEYWAKYYLVKDAIRMNRTDGALVRVITPIMPGEPLTDAKLRGRDFTAHMVPSLHRVIPD